MFFKDLRKLYWKAGVDNKSTVFLFTDTQVVDESFLEDINNILSSGEVPNLYGPEDFEEVCNMHVVYMFVVNDYISVCCQCNKNVNVAGEYVGVEYLVSCCCCIAIPVVFNGHDYVMQ